MPEILNAQPCFPADELEWILSEIRIVLQTGILTRGRHVTQFESLYAEYTGVRQAIGVSNGTAALEIALRYYAPPGAEVIVPTNTFLASANAVIFAGGKPVFADIGEGSLCFGLEQVCAQLTHRTRGVVVVHIAGMICPELPAIRDFCNQNGLFLIEDAAHAHGAQWNGRKAGSLADAGAFSFFPTKPMTTGEGGIITTDDEGLAAFSRMFRNHGVSEAGFVHETLGHNCRMDELSAILGISQLRLLDVFLAARRAAARHYETELSSIQDLKIFKTSNESGHSYYKFPILLPTRAARDALAAVLNNKYAIRTGTVYWPPCHLQPVVQNHPELYTWHGSLPNAEDVLSRVLCLPMHAQLNASAVARVIDAVKTEIRHQTVQ